MTQSEFSAIAVPAVVCGGLVGTALAYGLTAIPEAWLPTLITAGWAVSKAFLWVSLVAGVQVLEEWVYPERKEE